MAPARICPWRKMRRSRAPSIAPGSFFVAQSWADCITNMAGFNLRQAQPSFLVETWQKKFPDKQLKAHLLRVRLLKRPTPAHSGRRSEERRVGKECRSRWSPYH